MPRECADKASEHQKARWTTRAQAGSHKGVNGGSSNHVQNDGSERTLHQPVPRVCTTLDVATLLNGKLQTTLSALEKHDHTLEKSVLEKH